MQTEVASLAGGVESDSPLVRRFASYPLGQTWEANKYYLPPRLQIINPVANTTQSQLIQRISHGVNLVVVRACGE